jgi:hypothetical protein
MCFEVKPLDREILHETTHKIVSRDQWVEARMLHLKQEKELTRLRDELSAQRRDLPWVRVDKEYVYEGSNGKVGMPELFGDKSQLIVQTSCLDQTGTRAAKVARSGPTISTASSSTCSSVTSRSWFATRCWQVSRSGSCGPGGNARRRPLELPHPIVSTRGQTGGLYRRCREATDTAVAFC